MKQKYFFTDEMDDRIREVYQQEVGMKSKLHTGYLKKLSFAFGIPPWTISKRACKLGVLPTQRKEPNWADHELKILESSAHLSVPRIQNNLKKYGYSRTHQGILIKRKEMRFLKNLNGHSARSVAECFGVDPKTVMRWIEQGWLKATKRETNRAKSQGELFFIKDKWIKKFIVHSVSVVDFRKIDKYWLVDLLAN